MSKKENLIEDLLRYYNSIASFAYTREDLEKMSENKLKNLHEEIFDEDEDDMIFNGLFEWKFILGCKVILSKIYTVENILSIVYNK